MSRKMYALLLPVIAVAAMAMTAGAAQAAPHWFVCEKLATETGKFTDSECEKAGKGFWEWKAVGNAEHKVQVVTFGKLTLKTKTITLECKVIDGGNIWNPAGGGAGLDEILAFTNYECVTLVGMCAEPEIIAEKLPWSTKLLAGPPIKDEITGITITVKCGKAAVATFTGTLTPNMVNGSGGHPAFAQFTATTGKLKAGAEEAEVTGHDFLLTDEGEEVKVE
jgi:hypothetical protein